MEKLDSQTVQLIIVAAVAVTMLLQAIALLAIFFALRKAAQSIRQDVEELRSTVVPVIESVRELIAKTGPKIEATAVDLAAMSRNLRGQTADIQAAAKGIMERVQSQSARMDSMLTGIFDALDRVTGVMTSTVTKPMRQLAGLLASAKAVVESLRNDAHGAHAAADQSDSDEDMYV